MKFNIEKLIQSVEVKFDKESKFFTILTERLEIRTVTFMDIPFYQTLWSDKEIMEKFGEGQPRLYSGSNEEKQQKANRNAYYDYAEWRIATMENSWLKRANQGNVWTGLTILLKDSGKKIGHIVIGGGELAYFLIPSQWGKGYGSEAASALVQIGVPTLINEYGAQDPGKIIATVRQDHRASQKVLEHAGLNIDRDKIDIKEFNGIKTERYIASVDTAVLISQLKNCNQLHKAAPRNSF